MEELNNIKESFPFLSCVSDGTNEYICIIQNTDDKIITFYDLEKLNTEDKKSILEYGDNWWWESNRILPINIYFQGEMKKFRSALVTLPIKDVEVKFGPVTSLNNLVQKRIKRRQIQLVRNSN